jgi:heterodisulfide reductase subunit C
MSNWGFKINSGRQIDYDKNDNRFLMHIIEKEPSFIVCLSCGCCTATCTAGNLTDFNIRKLNVLLRRGEISDLQKEINKCMLCGKCQLVCPRGINTRNVILEIKKGIEKFSQL